VCLRLAFLMAASFFFFILVSTKHVLVLSWKHVDLIRFYSFMAQSQ